MRRKVNKTNINILIIYVFTYGLIYFIATIYYVTIEKAESKK